MIARPKFHGPDPALALCVYRRSLPHWRQDGATYFATFRLADSIPKHVVDRWKKERHIWYQAHGLTQDMSPEQWQEAYLRIPAQNRAVFERRNARHIFEETDKGNGCCLLRRPEVRSIVVEALHYFDGVRCWTGDFVVMPNHVHWLVQPVLGYQLEDLLGSIKRFTATQSAQREFPAARFWQRESYDRLVRDLRELARIRQYVKANPSKARLHEREYTYFHADWLDT